MDLNCVKNKLKIEKKFFVLLVLLHRILISENDENLKITRKKSFTSVVFFV